MEVCGRTVMHGSLKFPPQHLNQFLDGVIAKVPSFPVLEIIALLHDPGSHLTLEYFDMVLFVQVSGCSALRSFGYKISTNHHSSTTVL